MIQMPDRHGNSFHFEWDLCSQKYDLFFLSHDDKGERVFVSCAFNQYPTPGTRPPPLVTLEKETAQKLFNALWAAGLRPAAALQQDAVVEAKEANLVDLRRITDKLLETL